MVLRPISVLVPTEIPATIASRKEARAYIKEVDDKLSSICLGLISSWGGELNKYVYGAIGVPIFLITLADLGRFTKNFIIALVQVFSGTELRKMGERRLAREAGEVLLVGTLFVSFIAVGSALLPYWEPMSYFESVYFSYMSLTTIGLGDLVPKRMDFLLPTLIYITIGLWLTTVLVEQLADVFRLVHYAGRQVSNVKGIKVWLGGHQISMNDLIRTVCRRVGMSDNVAEQINWDGTIGRALNGHLPPILPIVPWNFADFKEHDPPLIDEELEELETLCNGGEANHYNGYTHTICNSPRHREQKLPSQSKEKGGPSPHLLNAGHERSNSAPNLQIYRLLHK